MKKIKSTIKNYRIVCGVGFFAMLLVAILMLFIKPKDSGDLASACYKYDVIFACVIALTGLCFFVNGYLITAVLEEIRKNGPKEIETEVEEHDQGL